MIFGPSSSLERIGVSCFERSGVEEVSIPDSVCELCDRCFYKCKSLCRVTFGPCSSLERIGVSCFERSGVEELERIGVSCFERSGVEEVSIPDSVRELCDDCFAWCTGLSRVNFGPSSSLERIGFKAFRGTRLTGSFVALSQ